MIVGNIAQLDESRIEYPNIIYQVLDTIRTMDFANHPNGEMVKDNVTYKTFLAKTVLASDRLSETHLDNIDVQFVISGNEGVKYQPLLNNEPDEIQTENDNYFYHKKIGQEQLLILKEGDFLILFPWDIHAPLCQIKISEEIRKIVAKVPLKLLIES